MHPLELICDHSHAARRRDFKLNDLPRDKRGNLLYWGVSELEYRSYVRWLSDYLSNTDIEPSPLQRDLCDLVSSLSKEDAMFLLGSYAAIHEYILVDSDTRQAIEERFDYSEIESFNHDDVQWICSRAREIREEYDREMNTLAEEGEQLVSRENICNTCTKKSNSGNLVRTGKTMPATLAGEYHSTEFFKAWESAKNE